MSNVTSKHPYLIRAMYEWIVDNNMTPYLVVDTTVHNVMVPMQYASDGCITLNISMHSVRDLEITDEAIMFSAMFRGVKENIYVPIEAVSAITSKEAGEVLVLSKEPKQERQEPPAVQPQAIPQKKKPVLRIVK